jgi:hypothetical protein
MKTFLCFLAAAAIAQEDIPRTLVLTNRVSVPVNNAVSKTTCMEVIDRTPEGALVRTFKVERKWTLKPVDLGPRKPLTVRVESSEPPFKDVRIDGEVLFVEGMGSDVGYTVNDETTLYSQQRSVSIKGTVYSVFSQRAPTIQFRDVENVTVSPNPAWIKREQDKKSNETRSRVVAYQTEQANKGLPSFQFELGKRYLKGDGVEVNTNLAIHWLKAACTNGESQASNLLNKIQALK